MDTYECGQVNPLLVFDSFVLFAEFRSSWAAIKICFFSVFGDL